MARAVDTDLYHNFRFHVVDPAGGNLDPVAGFRTASIPDLTVDMSEYREGVYKYTRKYPGIPKVGDCSLSKGVRRCTSCRSGPSGSRIASAQNRRRPSPPRRTPWS